jgi:hypothetical protein
VAVKTFKGLKAERELIILSEIMSESVKTCRTHYKIPNVLQSATRHKLEFIKTSAKTARP